ncbi:16449_t:CDS:10 [Entrophospora sp. SA101]|nr:16449_t:CDS:10 [Entrophospora sp. SA101]
MSPVPCTKYKNAVQNNNYSGGILTYVYRWKITNWSDVRPFMEHTSPPFSADGLQWVFKFYKGRQKNPLALSLYLGILETSPGCLRGVRKKVSIIFVLENLRTRGMDFGKMELPVWFCDKHSTPEEWILEKWNFLFGFVIVKHSTWGEENLMSLDEMDRFISNDTISLCVKFEIQDSIVDSPPLISNSFDQLVNSPEFSDITFHVHDEFSREKLFYAHKIILASSSPVFNAMLTNGMKETFENEIELHQINHSAFLTLLNIIYKSKFKINSSCEAEHLLALADRFAIVPVREECLRYFRLELNFDNVWGIWAIAEKYLCAKTSTTCKDYVALHFDALLEKGSTLHADPNILRLALENDEANVSSEEKIYELVVKWATYSPSNKSAKMTKTTLTSLSLSDNDNNNNNGGISSGEDNSTNLRVESSNSQSIKNQPTTLFMPSELPESDRLAALPSLLKCIRFPLMHKRYILEKVEGNPVIMAAEGMKDLVIEAYRFLLMSDLLVNQLTYRTKHRRRKTKAVD